MNTQEKDIKALTITFSGCWTSRDCDTLLTLLHDDCAYMVYEGGPVYRGPAAIERAVRPFMAKFERIEFEIPRLSVIGPLVIHERIEHYYAPGGELDTRFHVVGLLKIDAGKIAEWRDYAMPGIEQIVGPLCTKK